MKKGRTFCNLFIIQLPGSSRSKVFIFNRFYLIHVACTFYIDILDNKIDLELPIGIAWLNFVKLHHITRDGRKGKALRELRNGVHVQIGRAHV